jgi:phosphatidyl-N-methylethanolamine N-methyltransferase
MSVVALAVAAVLLAIERIAYILIARAPAAFLSFCARRRLGRRSGPTAVVERLFYAFKGLQFGVFIAWCSVHGGEFPWPARNDPFVMGLAAALAVAGQILVVATFYRLGRTGVFFGDQLGFAVRRCREFSFSLLSHPQYVGTLLTIWGGFLLVRFPHDDWYALPSLETIYYLAGMWLEVPRGRYGARYASITFKIRMWAARLIEGLERSRPT